MGFSFSQFHPAIATWFRETFSEPSPPQARGWPAIAAGKNVLLLAPTGSGKTLAAFLQCLDWLYKRIEAGDDINSGVQVLYISPLKALNNDIYRNLEVPIDGIKRTAERMGLQLPRLTSAIRTGDTPARARQAMLNHPPHILITTPESLFLMLCSKAREILRTVRFVIVDEIHSLFPTKRGAHLAISLEYLGELTGHPFQRIGLSATQRPLEEVAAFLGGGTTGGAIGESGGSSGSSDRGGGGSIGDASIGDSCGGCSVGESNIDGTRWIPRPVEIIDTGQRKELDLLVQVPVNDLRELPEKTVWPEIYRYLLGLVLEHRSTIIFVNNRRVAERVAANLNDLARMRDMRMRDAGFGTGVPDIARVHHGSMSREQRLEVEELLKEGKLRCLVATSSMELGIDVGSIDLVIQVESPHEVARGLQRVGRAGHLVGLPSKGRIVVKTRMDLLEAAVIAREMEAGRIERSRAPMNCLDVLAQQIVGLAVDCAMPVDDLFRLVRRAYNYRHLRREDFEAVLAALSGQFGADELIDLRPRIFWDRVNGLVRASETGKRLVYTNGGTIPDRGYFGVYTAGSPVRLGELDEEFVYERRIGDRFVLGTNTWEIEEIRQDRVIVAPARGAPTVIPFWRGEGFGRPYELGCTLGRFLEEIAARLDEPDLPGWLRRECLLDEAAARNLRDYLLAQHKATGVLPSSRSMVVEEFRDELGEWRVVIHSPFGQRVNGPLAMLLTAALRETHGIEVESVRTDDGILFLCPAAPEPPFIDPASLASLDLDDLERRLAGLVRTTPLFGMIFRHAAARALMLPRGPYGRKRTPLWLSRLKAADLLQVVDRYPSFPVVMEAYREILSEVFDIEGLREVILGLRTGAIQVHRCRRSTPSPFARPLVFGLVAAYMYEADLPKGERRLHALTMDPGALKSLLGGAGRDQLRQLLDPKVVREVVDAARRFRRFRSPDELHAWLLKAGEWVEDDRPPGAGAGDDLNTNDGACANDNIDVSNDEKLRGFLTQLRAAGRAVHVTWTVPRVDRTAEWGSGTGRGFATVKRQAWIAAENLPEYRAALGDRLIDDGYPHAGVMEGGGIIEGGNVTAGGGGETQDGAEISAEEARDKLIRRFARARGPFGIADVANFYGFSEEEVMTSISRLESAGFLRSGEFLPGGTGLEWCDAGLLQQIYRRSLAKARREVAPRDPEDYCAFLARWHGIGAPGAGAEGLSRALERLAGVFLPARLWEGGILQARVRGYEPGLLDQLIGSGFFTWFGRGNGEEIEIAICPAGEFPESIPGATRAVANTNAGASTGASAGANASADAGTDAGAGAGAMPGGSMVDLAGIPSRVMNAHAEIINLLREKGALFLPQIWQQTGLSVDEILLALEEMVRRGEVTNDTFGAVRSILATGTRLGNHNAGPGHGAVRVGSGPGPGIVNRSVASHPRLNHFMLNQMGRWSLIEWPRARAGGDHLAEHQLADRLARVCERLLARYGIVSREVASLEGFTWGPLNEILANWEMAGKVRRGYFVRGLSGVQYATTEAVDGLRLPRDAGLPRFWGLVVGDPANPWGKLFPWPVLNLASPHPGPATAYLDAGLHLARFTLPVLPSVVVLKEGTPVIIAGGRKVRVVSLKPLDEAGDLTYALRELTRVLGWIHYPGERGNRIEVAEWNGRPVTDTEAGEILAEFGFERGPRTMIKWDGTG
ncbi:MAG TPA: DEAD/DEAH box helicase [Firmicutes bacterium]|nr:DEAD/DEAH box helicase [Bacillota bacterium]